MREIRGWQMEGESAKALPVLGVQSAECEALFRYWRSAVMGNRSSTVQLPPAVGGYFYRSSELASSSVLPRPLGETRLMLRGIIDRAELTDEERTVVDLYFGFNGLPLPFKSRHAPDIASGRHESSPRGTCGSALKKLALQTTVRHLNPPGAQQSARSPLVEPWFIGAVAPADRVEVVARAYTIAVAQCDGPHSAPTLVALAHWYQQCGYVDPRLIPRAKPALKPKASTPRPNSNSLARASALVEIALYNEINSKKSFDLKGPYPQLPLSTAATPLASRLAERVTHPLLVALLEEELSPAQVVEAGEVIRHDARVGQDISGQFELFLRLARQRLGLFDPHEVERLAVSITYGAVATAKPFLALEWLGISLRLVGVTDRTFTVLVNTIEAASSSELHGLARNADHLYQNLLQSWEVPNHQIGQVEIAEASQQRLVVNAHRLRCLADNKAVNGQLGEAVQLYLQSARLASLGADLAHRILRDRTLFPDVEVAGKAGKHGGDLCWSWVLSALDQTLSPLQRLSAVSPTLPSDTHSEVDRLVSFSLALFERYDAKRDSPRVQALYEGLQETFAQEF